MGLRHGLGRSDSQPAWRAPARNARPQPSCLGVQLHGSLLILPARCWQHPLPSRTRLGSSHAVLRSAAHSIDSTPTAAACAGGPLHVLHMRACTAHVPACGLQTVHHTFQHRHLMGLCQLSTDTSTSYTKPDMNHKLCAAVCACSASMWHPKCCCTLLATRQWPRPCAQ